MIERRGGLRLALESRQSLRILGNFVGQEFQGYEPAEARVFGFIDHTHPATAQFFQDAVVRNRLAEKGLGVRHWRTSYQVLE
jgi:hypothetical protein